MMKLALNALLFFFFGLVLLSFFDPRQSVDFYTYYLASKAFSEGHPVYDFNVKPITNLARREGIEHHADLYYYPPLTAQLVRPLQDIPPRRAAEIWLGVSVVAVCFSLFLFIRIAGDTVPSPVLTFLTLGFVPLYSSLLGGQVNPLLLGTMAFTFDAIRRGRMVSAGLGAAIGGLLKYIALIYLLYLLVQRQWKALAMGLAVTIVLFFSALPWLGIETYLTFFSMFSKMLYWNHDTVGVNLAFAQGIQAILGPLDSEWLRLIRLLFTASILLLTLRVCWPTETQETEFTELEFALCTTTILLITPIVWYHLLLVLLIPLVVLLKQAWPEPQRPLLLALAGLGYLALNGYGVLFYTRLGTWLPAWVPGMAFWNGIPLLVSLLWWGCLWILLFQKNVRYPVCT
ncbi:MAG: glycosyltransferase family 87 protein, partial [bacterium]|nr:glycosyltransferase family 87 protein [bacterium]